MSTLDRSNRSWGPTASLPEGLWSKFEEITPANVEELIGDLAISVSNGWMGVAAEISEHLQIAASDLLDEDPSLRLRVEIERLKRFSYMGFEETTKSASRRVLNLLQAFQDKLPREDRLQWESVAVSSVGWFLQDPVELQEIIKRCKDIDGRFATPSRVKDLCASFMHALEGRANALARNAPACHNSFKIATRSCRENHFWLPLAHINIHYAESLRLLNDWQNATKMAKDFLKDCCKDQRNSFRSHLMLRAILLLLQAPERYMSAADFEFNAHRYHMLVYAMGLEQSQTVYPLLEKAERLIALKGSIARTDLYHLFLPGPIVDRINAFDGPSLEKLVMSYYESNNFKVNDVAEALPAVDLVATKQDGTQQVFAIQVKSRRGVTGPDEIPNEVDFNDAKRLLREQYSVSDISCFHWHSSSKLQYRAEELLNMRVKNCFGSNCGTRIILNDELVSNLLVGRQIEILFRIFSNEFKTKPEPRYR
jgi:hypothetical protein